MKTTSTMTIPTHLVGVAAPVGAETVPDASFGVRPVAMAFRSIMIVVTLLLVFAVVQMATLWKVCDTGMKAATSLQRQGLPTLSELAALQELLATYRLKSYEYLFTQETNRPEKAREVATVAAGTRATVGRLEALLPDGEGRDLAGRLGRAVDELDAEFGRVSNLVDKDFAAAMTAMDRDIPPKIERVSAAADALKRYGYRVSGGEASATFGDFGWIRWSAVGFGLGSIVTAFGAVIFVLVAARRTRAQLSATLARLDQRTQELARSLSLMNATLESTNDGFLVVDLKGQGATFNRRFKEIWDMPAELADRTDRPGLLAFTVGQVREPEAFVKRIQEIMARREADSFDELELSNGRIFERHSQPQRVGQEVVGRVWCFRDITERRQAEARLAESHRQLLDVSRQAGMAEVATDVLHNVGNVLNSVNVSATLVIEQVRESKLANLSKLGQMLQERAGDLPQFLTSDPKGCKIPAYLPVLAGELLAERTAIEGELAHLRKNVEHIKQIVAMQQTYAKVTGVTETVPLAELAEDALRMNAGGISRHGVEVIREFEAGLSITVARHKVLQILVNLLRNAKNACVESGRPDKRITLRIARLGDRANVVVFDNGVGIPRENLTRIFALGFTTRQQGHGFGLHSAALAAKELGGTLSARSDGAGHGAVFTLDLPMAPLHERAGGTHP